MFVFKQGILRITFYFPAKQAVESYKLGKISLKRKYLRAGYCILLLSIFEPLKKPLYLQLYVCKGLSLNYQGSIITFY